MLVLVCKVPVWIRLCFAFPLNCRLRAILANFGYSKNIRNFSKYHQMDPKFAGNGNFRKSKKFVLLRAVLANFGFAVISIFNSAQC